ncbi:MAG: IS200/IS605 family element transposase accessory protein TnpB [Caldilineaceae bacterium SB0664_bin_22]|nr:IS200/IS605 family element transposase accessory protein TnpB [Caldilineaceae bacterium SB0664_bin_22]
MSEHLKGVGKSHRIALDPTDRQATRMLEHAGWARVAANWARGRFQLAWFGHTDEQHAEEWYAHVDVNPGGGTWLSDMDLRREFNAVKADLFAWSCDHSQNVSKNAIIHMGRGLDAWGEYCKARKHGKPHRKVGFPPLRKRHRKLAFTPSNGRHSIKVDGRQVHLPKIGWVRMREALRFDGDIMSVTVSRKAGRWFASFTVDTCEPAPDPKPGPDIGIDMGIRTLATVWDGEEGEEIANPKALARALKSLRRLDKAIARSLHTHGRHNPSQRRDGLYAKRNRLYFDIANLRADHHHKATTQIAKRGGTVKVETLNVDGMKRNRRLARPLSDAGMSEFVRQLEYKCAWYGTAFEKVDRWYPSSKTCSACGAVKQSLLLSERTYRCNLCGFECDRDENAARNLQAYTGHSEPARHLNEFPGPARSAGGERDVETHRSHRREACARSVKRLPDSQPPCSAIAPDCGRLV